MTYRTTFALDGETKARLSKLSVIWHVSRAEVVRRALKEAEQKENQRKPDAIGLLQAVHESGQGLDSETADQYLYDVRDDRKQWRKS